MEKYEFKYGVEEDEEIWAFHRSRRMFCIKNGKLVIAEPNLSYSHADWFEKEGWMDETDDSFMINTTRGMVDKKGDIYFYRGYDFVVDVGAEEELFNHLEELAKALGLKPLSGIYGGKNLEEGKFYGTLGDTNQHS